MREASPLTVASVIRVERSEGAPPPVIGPVGFGSVVVVELGSSSVLFSVVSVAVLLLVSGVSVGALPDSLPLSCPSPLPLEEEEAEEKEGELLSAEALPPLPLLLLLLPFASPPLLLPPLLPLLSLPLPLLLWLPLPSPLPLLLPPPLVPL